MKTDWGTANSRSDINRDGNVNSIDFSYLNKNWAMTGDGGAVTPPVTTTGSWPAADGSDVGLNSAGCSSTRTNYTGPNPITTNNTTISNANFTSQLNIEADNVTISCSSMHALNNNYGFYIKSTADNTIIEKSRIYGTNDAGCRQGKGIYLQGTNAIIRNNNMYGGEDNIQADGSGTIEFNWLHDPNVSTLVPPCTSANNLHADYIAKQSGSNVLITRNRFAGVPNGSIAAIMVQPAPASACPVMSNIDIVNNYIDADGTGNVVLLDRSVGCACPTGMDITNNKFGPLGGPPSSASPIRYGSGDKSCTPVTSRGGTCSGNIDSLGNPVGC